MTPHTQALLIIAWLGLQVGMYKICSSSKFSAIILIIMSKRWQAYGNGCITWGDGMKYEDASLIANKMCSDMAYVKIHAEQEDAVKQVQDILNEKI